MSENPVGIAIETDFGDVYAMVERYDQVFSPGGFTEGLVPRLIAMAHEMQDESFSSERDWPALSVWREEERGSDHPILDFTGSFREEVSHYTGDVVVGGVSEIVWDYPGVGASGRYWGLTAGQKVNPLARYTKRTGKPGVKPYPRPLKQFPRPILFGDERLFTGVNHALTEFLGQSGLLASGAFPLKARL